MRSKRAAGERRIEEALAALANALDASGIPWMVIGGIAIIARGVRRMTTDIDAVVRGDRTDTKALLRLLAGKRIVPRISDVEAFARESLVLLLQHDPTGVGPSRRERGRQACTPGAAVSAATACR